MHRSTSHPTAPRLRSDVVWTQYPDQSRWTACDPLTTSFYSFSELERSAAQLMTGRSSPQDILGQLCAAYPTAGLDPAWLGGLLKRMQQHHLLVPSTRSDAARIAKLRSQSRRTGWRQQWFSPLAIRVPLFNPTGLLNFLRPVATLLFHPLTVGVWLIAGVCLGLLVLRELLQGNATQTFDLTTLRGDRWLLLFGCYLMAKSLHELGHGLACVRYRAQCHEMGLMLLCLAPCLYCDTTDAWKLSSKWQRAAIAAAGMYVEWILATLAAAVWLWTQAGTLHYVAAGMMLVCSIGTLLINSNPLLKYDGYYILSDLWGVPNLTDQGREALRAVGHYLLAGRPLAQSHFDASPLWLAMFALVSGLYRIFILGAILWILWTALVPMGLGLVAVLLTAMLVMGVVLGQLRGLQLFVRQLLATGGLHITRWIVFLSLLLLIGVAILEYPLPRVIRARGVSDFADKEPLFASQTAELSMAAPRGRRLSLGTRLLKFQSPNSQLEWLELRGQVAVLEEELKQLNLRSALDPSTAYAIPAKTEELKELRSRERVLAREIEALEHVASEPGYLIAGPHHVPPPLTAPHDDRFSRHPLDPNSLGATCERSTLVGWFTKKEQPTLSVIVPEQDVKRLKLGMRAAIQWDSNLNSIGDGLITRISPDPIRETPVELIGDATLLSTRNAQGVFLPEKPHYEVTLDVSHSATQLRGAPATVQFEVAPQTIWQRVVDLVRQNLKPL
jgi:putative peptide zinc metalloprotease protein